MLNSLFISFLSGLACITVVFIVCPRPTMKVYDDLPGLLLGGTIGLCVGLARRTLRASAIGLVGGIISGLGFSRLMQLYFNDATTSPFIKVHILPRLGDDYTELLIFSLLWVFIGITTGFFQPGLKSVFQGILRGIVAGIASGLVLMGAEEISYMAESPTRNLLGSVVFTTGFLPLMWNNKLLRPVVDVEQQTAQASHSPISVLAACYTFVLLSIYCFGKAYISSLTVGQIDSSDPFNRTRVLTTESKYYIAIGVILLVIDITILCLYKVRQVQSEKHSKIIWGLLLAVVGGFFATWITYHLSTAPQREARRQLNEKHRDAFARAHQAGSDDSSREMAMQIRQELWKEEVRVEREEILLRSQARRTGILFGIITFGLALIYAVFSTRRGASKNSEDEKP